MSESVFYVPKCVRISEVIERLQAIKEKEGDLKVAFGSWDVEFDEMVYTDTFEICTRTRDEDVDRMSAVEPGELFVSIG